MVTYTKMPKFYSTNTSATVGLGKAAFQLNVYDVEYHYTYIYNYN